MLYLALMYWDTDLPIIWLQILCAMQLLPVIMNVVDTTASQQECCCLPALPFALLFRPKAIGTAQEAKAQNQQKRNRDSPAAITARLGQPKPALASATPSSTKKLPPAEELKEQGNVALKQGKLKEVKLPFHSCLHTSGINQKVGHGLPLININTV